jgi:iron complex transport system ATP-binding protein
VDLAYEVDGARLLDRVSLWAERGEFVGVIGPNGAGKTTLLRTISGLLRRTAGAVAMGGRPLDSMSAREVAKLVAQVPQLPTLTYGFTCIEVVLMGRYPHLDRFQLEGPEDERIAREAMRLTETEGFAQRTATTLSGGERQRVSVARALAQEPAILLMDEPTANLDIQHQLKMLELVRSLVKQGITAITAMHDLSLAARYCHRLVLLHQGRVVGEGPGEAVLTPENLRRVFGVDALVYRDPLNAALTISLLGPDDGQGGGASKAAQVHVICGGGSGAHVMYRLQTAGYRVTAGVLGAGDTDRSAADILGIEYVALGAFQAIGPEEHRRHLALAAAADCVVLCDMPVSHHNLPNLQAAGATRHLVCMGATPMAQRDFAGGEAQRLFDALQPVALCADASQTLEVVSRLLSPKG